MTVGSMFNVRALIIIPISIESLNGTVTPIMLIYAGIDEAGYGPMLGPLCIAATVFVVNRHDPNKGAPDLWKILAKAVCRSRRDAQHRIAVDDSKKLKGAPSGSRHPLTHLERGVLAFLAVDRDLPATDDCLFDHLGSALQTQSTIPWNQSSTTLPLCQNADSLRITIAMLKRVMLQTEIRCEMMACEAIDAGLFNDQVEKMGNKASVNLCAVLRRIDRIWQRWPHEHPRIIVDRLGGRTHYREDLQLAFPEAHIQILAETAPICRYRLNRNQSHLTVSFVVDAETRHLPVALASMTAKYVRELHMSRLNRFFQNHLPELKPTAGYFQDGQRYLRDIQSVVTKLNLDRSSLVRRV